MSGNADSSSPHSLLWREDVLHFGAHATQRGIWCRPAQQVAPGPLDGAAIFINAGLIHHVGPNRLYVQLARALAEVGVASLRLDLSGIGDSGVRVDNLPIFDLVRREPVEAMDALAALGYGRFALAGLCSGAYSAFHAACADPRVAAAVMINPEDLEVGGAPGAQSWARRYFTRSIFRPRAWLNLINGRANYSRLLATLRQHLGAQRGRASPVGPQPVVAELSAAVLARPLRLFFLTCDDDVSTQYLATLLGGRALHGLPEGAVLHEVMPQCDHLFTRLQDQRRLRERLVPWLQARLLDATE